MIPFPLLHFSGVWCLGPGRQNITKSEQHIQVETRLHDFFSPSDIQEFYEVTLLDSQRWPESSKTPDAVTAVTLWDFSSLPSTAVTSDTLPSLSTSIEVTCMSCGLPPSDRGSNGSSVEAVPTWWLQHRVPVDWLITRSSRSSTTKSYNNDTTEAINIWSTAVYS